MNKPKHSARTLSKEHRRICRKKTETEKYMNKLDAWAKGQKVYFTVQNPNKNETNKPFIKVEGIQYLGHYKQPNVLVPGKRT